jgi:predicted transcriptional regulator YdeE
MLGMARVVERAGFVVIGIQVRTTNREERDPATARIPGLWGRFMAGDVAGAIAGRKGETVYAVYSDYESDHHGAYSLTLGWAVEPSAKAPAGLARVEVPAGRYAVLTSERGPAPRVVPQLWQRVWSASEGELGGRRAFRVDFEVYDERSRDPADAEVELNLGL